MTPLRCSDILLFKSTNIRYVSRVSSRKAQYDSERPELNEINASNRVVGPFTADPREEKASKYARRLRVNSRAQTYTSSVWLMPRTVELSGFKRQSIVEAYWDITRPTREVQGLTTPSQPILATSTWRRGGIARRCV